MKKLICVIYICAISLSLFCAKVDAAPALPSYNVDPNGVSVSGISSGGEMSEQLGIAYSSVFRAGFGVFAAGPYDNNRAYCFYILQTNCLTANMLAWSGKLIDPVSNLANRRVYLWEGSADMIVGVALENLLYAQLAYFDSPNNIEYVITNGAEHTFPTDFTGPGYSPCSWPVSPWISSCNYDGAGSVLQWLYGPLNARNNGLLSGQVLSFDQGQFIPSGEGMDGTGYLYVPASCAQGQPCRLHVVLHGCLDSASFVGTAVVTNSGYNGWADTNNIIVLYPQAFRGQSVEGCWDYVGWYGNNYDQIGGVQMAAIVSMVRQVTKGFNADGAIPAAPTGLSVVATSVNSVNLAWTPSANATGYLVYRNGANIGSSPTPAFMNANLPSASTYTYTVTAVNNAGESLSSNPVTANTKAF